MESLSLLDVATLIGQNTGTLVLTFFATAVALGLLILLIYPENKQGKLKDHIDKNATLIATVIVLTGFLNGLLFAFIPTHDKLLELKIAKIKNELVTEKNVNGTVDTVLRVAEKLECKYLGECSGENN